jgi:NAD kinase
VLSRVPGRGQAALGLRIDAELLVRYSSDGVIIATPRGSTAWRPVAHGSRHALTA